MVLPQHASSVEQLWLMHSHDEGIRSPQLPVCRPPRRPKKLWDPLDDGGKWLHDKFELLDLAPEQDDYQVQLCMHAVMPSSMCIK